MARRGLNEEPSRLTTTDGPESELPQTLCGLGDLRRLMHCAERHGVWFTLGHVRADAVTAVFHLFGQRIEVSLFADRAEYVTYRGTEEVHDDRQRLFDLIDAGG